MIDPTHTWHRTTKVEYFLLLHPWGQMLPSAAPSALWHSPLTALMAAMMVPKHTGRPLLVIVSVNGQPVPIWQTEMDSPELVYSGGFWFLVQLLQ